MKKPTPKKRQPPSLSDRRYKVFQNLARQKLRSMTDSMQKLERLGKLETTTKKSPGKITKVKA